jgi:hypothetical protein
VDAAVAVHHDPVFRLLEVEQAEARMLPFAAKVTLRQHPQPGSDAKFSSPHCIAVALTKGTLGLDAFDLATVRDPGITALREKAMVTPDACAGKRGAVLTVRLRDGSVVARTVEQNRGTPGNRLSDRDLEQNLCTVAAPLIGAATVDQVIRHCWNLGELGEDAGRDPAALADLEPVRFGTGADLGVADAVRGSPVPVLPRAPRGGVLPTSPSAAAGFRGETAPGACPVDHSVQMEIGGQTSTIFILATTASGVGRAQIYEAQVSCGLPKSALP